MKGDSGSAGECNERDVDFDLSSPSARTSLTLMVLPFLLCNDPSIDLPAEWVLVALVLVVFQVTLDGVVGREGLLVSVW